MNEKMNIKEIIKVGLILFVITSVSAGLLGVVNAKTAPLIEQNNIIKEQKALNNVMPYAEFEETEITSDIENLTDSNGEIIKVYKAKDNSGNTIGACVITETKGYDVGIQIVTGVDTDLKITGIDIISMNETPGLGAKANNDDFKAQYTGKGYEIKVIKSPDRGINEIEAISGATKTSNGVTNGVNIALQAAEKILKGGDK